MFSCFRGYQLHNPFHTIWATKVGNNLAVSFYIRVYSSSVLAILQRLVSANRWLRGIKTYRFPWYLTLVSANHASSNPGQG